MPEMTTWADCPRETLVAVLSEIELNRSYGGLSVASLPKAVRQLAARDYGEFTHEQGFAVHAVHIPSLLKRICNERRISFWPAMTDAGDVSRMIRAIDKHLSQEGRPWWQRLIRWN